jgi:hypothetical protein
MQYHRGITVYCPRKPGTPIKDRLAAAPRNCCSCRQSLDDPIPPPAPPPRKQQAACQDQPRQAGTGGGARAAITPKARPYKELGSVEGHIQKIERDGFGRSIGWIRERLTGETIKFLVSGAAEKELEGHQFKDVWHFRRVRVYGTLYYKGLGVLREIDAVRVRFMPNNDELPKLDDILDRDFTGGLRSEDYLTRLRDGNL